MSIFACKIRVDVNACMQAVTLKVTAAITLPVQAWARCAAALRLRTWST